MTHTSSYSGSADNFNDCMEIVGYVILYKTDEAVKYDINNIWYKHIYTHRTALKLSTKSGETFWWPSVLVMLVTKCTH